MSAGVVPNPHWWKQSPVVYHYQNPMHIADWSHLMFFVVVFPCSIYAPHLWWMRVIAALVLLGGGLFLRRYVGEQGGGRIETRFQHITLFKSDRVIVHESMQDLISLKPVMKRDKLWYYEAVFWSGTILKIYSSLENLDRLLALLQSHLESAQKQ
jgi:hypothetical protein